VEVVASLSQGRIAAAQCRLFTHKSVPVIFEPPCNSSDQINMKETGGASDAWARREMYTSFWCENLKKISFLENSGEKGRMMLKRSQSNRIGGRGLD
jgi:hypothetical protein